jgi:hypothetical protein
MSKSREEMLHAIVKLIEETQPSSAVAPICRKEICGGFPKMNWTRLSPPFKNRRRRGKRSANGPPVSIEWTRRVDAPGHRIRATCGTCHAPAPLHDDVS